MHGEEHQQKGQVELERELGLDSDFVPRISGAEDEKRVYPWLEGLSEDWPEQRSRAGKLLGLLRLG